MATGSESESDGGGTTDENVAANGTLPADRALKRSKAFQEGKGGATAAAAEAVASRPAGAAQTRSSGKAARRSSDTAASPAAPAAKKAKAADGSAAAASKAAPAASPAAPANLAHPDGVAESSKQYATQLAAALKASGGQFKMSQLGLKVKRPDGALKMGQLIKHYNSWFEREGHGGVLRWCRVVHVMTCAAFYIAWQQSTCVAGRLPPILHQEAPPLSCA